MDNPIITTKGTTKSYRIMSLFGGGTLIFLGYRFISYSQEVWGKRSSQAFFIGLLLWFFALLLAFVVATKATSYVDVFADKIIGKGIQKTSGGSKVVDFNLSYEEIVSITCDVSNLYVVTAHEKFQIITNADKAKEIFDYYVTNIKNCHR